MKARQIMNNNWKTQNGFSAPSARSSHYGFNSLKYFDYKVLDTAPKELRILRTWIDLQEQ